MRLLIDAHALIWYVDQDHLLSPTARAALADPANDRVLSAGTIWEIAIKVGLKKLNLSQPYRLWMEQAITGLGAMVLAITVDHADAQAGLPHHHRDPFDRLLVAQALIEKLPVVSADAQLDVYGINRLW
jgi:PIN domain nuclease of toxin-antitoxin system